MNTTYRTTLTIALSLGAFASGSAFAADKAAPFTLPALPYAADALEPAIDAETMRIHHGRHHKAYIDNLNAKTGEFPALSTLSLEDIQQRISTFDAATRNNAGGHWNHSLFWTLMAPVGKGGQPSEALNTEISKSFGSLAEFKTQFNKAGAARFGSGWAWLVWTSQGLKITSTPNQDNPLMDVADARGVPLLAADVWEHAYYLKYQNKRADYLEAWWTVVNWNEVNRLFDAARKKCPDNSASGKAQSRRQDPICGSERAK